MSCDVVSCGFASPACLLLIVSCLLFLLIHEVSSLVVSRLVMSRLVMRIPFSEPTASEPAAGELTFD